MLTAARILPVFQKASRDYAMRHRYARVNCRTAAKRQDKAFVTDAYI